MFLGNFSRVNIGKVTKAANDSTIVLNDYPYTYATRMKENLLEQQQQSSAEELNNVSSSSTIATTDGDAGLSWKLIGEDINVLPEFTIEYVVLQYFIYRKENGGLERQDWNNFNSGGFKLFKEGIFKKYMSVIHNKCLCKSHLLT